VYRGCWRSTAPQPGHHDTLTAAIIGGLHGIHAYGIFEPAGQEDVLLSQSPVASVT
jgi:hypothetical protein